jgi:CcmD family protein
MDARNFTYMFYGFTAAWVIIVIYVITLVSREKRIRQQVDQLKRMLDSGEKR